MWAIWEALEAVIAIPGLATLLDSSPYCNGMNRVRGRSLKGFVQVYVARGYYPTRLSESYFIHQKLTIKPRAVLSSACFESTTAALLEWRAADQITELPSTKFQRVGLVGSWV